MTARRLWIPALAGLLVAGVLGVGGGGAVAVEPRVVTASIMIPAAAFIPAYDGIDYTNGAYLQALGGPGQFMAPVWFPIPEVKITRFTLYAVDNTPNGYICADLFRSRPAAGTYDRAGRVCTADSTAVDPQTYTTAVRPMSVDTASYGVHVTVTIWPPTYFYAVKITYTYSPGA